MILILCAKDGDIGSMDYDQAVKNGDIFFGWSTWMEQDGYAPGESIAFDFENGSGTYTYQGKIAGSFVSADTYLVIPEGVYRSMNPRGTAYGYLWVDCDKKDVASVEQSLNTLISNTSHIKMDTYHAQLHLIIGLPLGYALFSYAKHNGIFGMKTVVFWQKKPTGTKRSDTKTYFRHCASDTDSYFKFENLW